MTALLRRFSIRRRLIALAVIPLVLVVLVAAMAISGFGAMVDETRDAQVSTGKSEVARDLTYQAADWNGWQAAYAVDINRGVRGDATDMGESRAAFLAAAATLGKTLSAFETRSDLDEAEVQFSAEARAASPPAPRRTGTCHADRASSPTAGRA